MCVDRIRTMTEMLLRAWTEMSSCNVGQPSSSRFSRRKLEVLSTRFPDYGINNAVPVTAVAWYQAPFTLSGTGGMIQGAQLPGR